MTPRRAPLAIAAISLLVASGCGSDRTGAPAASVHPSSRSTTAASPTPPPSPVTTSPAPDAAHRAFDALTEQQRVGQLFMVGTPATGADPAVVAEIKAGQVGSVFLAGNSTLPVGQIAAIVAGLQQPARPIGLFVATDQEGGTVQRLKGPDFDRIPSALGQGLNPPAAERADAKKWGTELVAAGVNLDLAPVMDTVPSAGFAPSNPPIGSLDREFGYAPALVSATGSAFVQGLLDAGVDSTAKHFPGLGRVTGNTDTSSGVTDSTTTRTDPDLAPFAAAIAAGTPFVMMSLAIYPKIDPAHPAAFSSAMITGLLRGDLHFGGVVISDDLGATEQVDAVPIGQRAVDFIAAGGDVVLTVAADQIAAMNAAVLARVAADTRFAAQVDASALRVLEAKQARGLLG